jgi:hypothetical protein
MKTIKDKSVSYLKNRYFIGTQTGKCPLCKQTKTLLLLKYGLTVCEDCLNLAYGVFFALQVDKNNLNQKQGKTRIQKSKIKNGTKAKTSL